MTVQNDIASKLATINSAFNDIKDSIIEKGVTPSGDVTTYSAAIDQIVTEPVLDTITISPSTTAQVVTPSSGVDGFDEVNVNAVTAAIDNNITAGNIKKDVTILGVTGNYEGGSEPLLQNKTLTVNSTTPTVASMTADSGYDGIDTATVDMTYVEDELDDVLTGSVVLSSVEATDYLEGVRSALIRMGVNVDSNTPYSQFATKIGEISMGSTKVTFADGYYFLDEGSNYCKLVIDTEYGEMTHIGTTNLPQSSDYLASHNACTIYRYKREITLPVTFAGIPNIVPFVNRVDEQGTLVPSEQGLILYNANITTPYPYITSGFPEDTWNYSSSLTWPVHSGTIDYNDGKVILYQKSVDTNTYISTARVKVVFEGEITPPSQE